MIRRPVSEDKKQSLLDSKVYACICWIYLHSCFLFTDGTDFIGINKALSFSQSGQTHCVDVDILKDAVSELDEDLTLELKTLFHPPVSMLSLDMWCDKSVKPTLPFDLKFLGSLD